MIAEEIAKLRKSLEEAGTLSLEEIAVISLGKQRQVLEEFLEQAGLESRLPREIIVIESFERLATEVSVFQTSHVRHGRVFYHGNQFWVAEDSDTLGLIPSLCERKVEFTEKLLKDVLAFCDYAYNPEGQAPVKTYPGLYPAKIVTQFAAGGYEESPKTKIRVFKADTLDVAVKEAIGAGGTHLLELEIFSEGKWHLVMPDGERWFPYVTGLRPELVYKVA
ncbi:MAG: hypothetical protein AAB642_01545 [Patescibacteria group bacterium]